jgi:hypothetical protein
LKPRSALLDTPSVLSPKADQFRYLTPRNRSLTRHRVPFIRPALAEVFQWHGKSPDHPTRHAYLASASILWPHRRNQEAKLSEPNHLRRIARCSGLSQQNAQRARTGVFIAGCKRVSHPRCTDLSMHQGKPQGRRIRSLNRGGVSLLCAQGTETEGMVRHLSDQVAISQSSPPSPVCRVTRRATSLERRLTPGTPRA